MPRHDPFFDPRIDGMGAPANISQALVEPDRRALRVAQIEVKDRQADFAGEPFALSEAARLNEQDAEDLLAGRVSFGNPPRAAAMTGLAGGQ